MDIFTTQLAQVVQRPIKPEDFKVKALLKESASSKLSQDPEHLENHKYYLKNEDKKHNNNTQKNAKGLQDSSKKNKKENSKENANESEGQESAKFIDDNHLVSPDEITYEKHGSEVSIEKKHDDDDDTKHLDLYA
ncbi:hypothetical protein [Colwellia echini]|uniref:Uncharacterized protein n=1 Tax=Colwellia echini TaxID=1982103 RepID=A0ABY3MTZ7_9GAMM|nr:hypothetical protein [Colwellia echini]TYK64599.1 hypothetical protein CWS31_014735 [Colwellia echini]